MVRHAAGVVGFVLASATDSNAQPTSIPAGARVRVAFVRNNPDDSRSPSLQGTLLAADDTAFVIMPRRAGSTPRLIRVAPNVRLELHAGTRGTNLGRGALAGLIAGSVVGFGIGAAADTECECRLALGAATGLVFGLGGTFIGSGIGATMPRHVWRPVTLPVRLEPRPQN